jgi:hypothetical protein
LRLSRSVEQQIKSFLGDARKLCSFHSRFSTATLAAEGERRVLPSWVFARIGSRGRSAKPETDGCDSSLVAVIRFAVEGVQDLDLLERCESESGAPYIGSSAVPTSRADDQNHKDMPIVSRARSIRSDWCRFKSVRIFRDPDPNSRHMGETQEERIVQFLEENETPVSEFVKDAWLLCGKRRRHIERRSRRQNLPPWRSSGRSKT